MNERRNLRIVNSSPRRWRTLLAAVSALLMMGQTVQAAPVLRLSYTVSPASIWHRAAQRFEQRVEARSGGRLQVELYPGGVLAGGNDRVELELAQAGALQGVLKSTLWLAQLDRRYTALALPWVFPDTDTAMARINGPLAPVLAEGVARANLRPLAWGAGGFFQLYSNRGPIRDPGDLAGIKIRVPGMDLFVDAWEALGAVPVSMSFAEVYPALQAGVIEGGTSPLTLISASRFHEVSRYITRLDVAFEAVGLLLNADYWRALAPADRRLVSEAAEEAMAAMTAETAAEEAAIRGRLAAAGVTFTELNADERAQFRDRLQPVYRRYRERLGSNWVARVAGEAP